MIKTNKFSAILLIAGNSTRFNQSINKSLYELNKKPLFLYSLEKFKLIDLNKIYLVVKEEEKYYLYVDGLGIYFSFYQKISL
mgnify:CR=1 FL=1